MLAVRLQYLTSWIHNKIHLPVQIELELTDTITERNELHGQLTALDRIKTSLEGELASLSSSLHDKNKLVDQLNSDKEALTKGNAEMEVNIEVQYTLLLYTVQVFLTWW